MSVHQAEQFFLCYRSGCGGLAVVTMSRFDTAGDSESISLPNPFPCQHFNGVWQYPGVGHLSLHVGSV